MQAKTQKKGSSEAGAGTSAVALFGPFAFDLGQKVLSKDGHELALSPRVTDLLAYLLGRAGEVVSKEDLFEQVWQDAYVSEAALTRAMSLLRTTLGDQANQPSYIQTLHRRGYRLIAPVQFLDPLELEEASPNQSSADDHHAHHTAPSPQSTDLPLPSPPGPSPTGSPPRRGISSGQVLVGIVLLLISSWIAWSVATGPDEPAEPTILSIVPGEHDLVVANPSFSLRGDGRELVFSIWSRDGQAVLARRNLAAPDFERINPDEAGYKPVYAADGQSIFFAKDNEFRQFRFDSEHSEPALRGEHACGVLPLPHDDLLVSECPFGGFALWSAGVRVRTLTAPDRQRGDISHHQPQLLPGETQAVFSIWRGVPEASALGLLDLQTGSWRILLEHAYHPRYADHFLFFLAGHTLQAAAFDPQSGVLRSPPSTLDLEVDANTMTGVARLEVQADTLAYLQRRDGEDSTPALTILGDGGTRTLEVLDGLQVDLFSVDTHRHRLAYSARGSDGSDLWVMDLSTGQKVRRTTGAVTFSPSFEPDGNRLLYTSNTAGPLNLYVDSLDGSAPRRIWPAAEQQMADSWLPGTSTICYTATNNHGSDLWLLDLDQALPPNPLLTASANETSCSIAPDGKWLAFISDEGGLPNVYISRFPETHRDRTQLSFEGGLLPFWSLSGDALYWRDSKFHLMRARRSSSNDGPFLFEAPDQPYGDLVIHHAALFSETEILATLPPSGGSHRPGSLQVVVGWQALLAESAARSTR